MRLSSNHDWNFIYNFNLTHGVRLGLKKQNEPLIMYKYACFYNKKILIGFLPINSYARNVLVCVLYYL